MIEQNSASVQLKINEVQNQQNLPDDIKLEKIAELRKSLVVQKGTDSSFKVVTNIANTMIGSSVIVYPIMFIKDGIIGALLVLLAIGAALYATCRLLLIHNRPDQMEFGETIKRILGKHWALLNSIVNFSLIYMVSIAYFMLICSNFFDISSALLHQFIDYESPAPGTISLSTYSTQYASLICLIFVSPFLWKKDIEILMKFFKYTIYFVFFYGFFILAALVRTFADGSLNFSLYPKFNPDFSTVAGAFALSLLIHPVGAPILKRNINQKNNMRDLFLGYCLTALIYVYVGFFGALTCSHQIEDINGNPNNYETVFDCFKKSQQSSSTEVVFFVFGKVVQLGIFLQNLSVMPILSFITRKQLIGLVESKEAKRRAYIGYNISMMVFCFAITFFEVDVSVILSIDGGIIGFFMAYAIPITTHLVCYHRKLTSQQKVARTELLLSVDSESGETDAEIMEQALKCNEHEEKSKVKHYALYGGLMAIGAVLGMFKIYAMFK